MKTVLLPLMLCLCLSAAPVQGETPVSIDQACASCQAAGVTAVSKAIQSPLKKETSLIGMAYLNYIYQNDLTNEHFCQAMLLMRAQVPANTTNPYTALFEPGMGEQTLAVLEDVQLSFDYSIARSHPPEAKMRASIEKIKAVLKNHPSSGE